jgi:hypothetical protein
MTVSFALNGYQPQTLEVRPEVSQAQGYSESPSPNRLQPNPVYAELQPVHPPAKKKRPAKKKQTAQKASPPPAEPPPPGQSAPDPNPAYPGGFPWPDPQAR